MKIVRLLAIAFFSTLTPIAWSAHQHQPNQALNAKALAAVKAIHRAQKAAKKQQKKEQKRAAKVGKKKLCYTNGEGKQLR